MIRRSNPKPEWDSEDKKKELARKLKAYDGAINNALYDYLHSLLELEFSAINNELSKKQRDQLTQIDFSLYRQISIYNIHCRLLRLFEADKDKLEIHKSPYFQKFDISVEGKEINEDDIDEDPNLYLFNFNFEPQHGPMDLKVFLRTGSRAEATAPSTIVGNINIGQFTEREGQTEKNIELYKRLIGKHKSKSLGTFVGTATDTSDPTLYGNVGHFGTCNDDMAMAKYYRDERVRKLRNILHYYENKHGLTDAEKLAIEMSQKYYELILQEFGLKQEEFQPAKTYVDSQVLTLTKPNYNIKNTINYVE